MEQKFNIVGKRFGFLTVVEDSGIRNNSRAIMWRCVCDCGKERVVSGTILRAGKAVSCGCGIENTDIRFATKKVRDLTGKVFGNLTVLRLINTDGGNANWECKCSCGCVVSVVSRNLVSGSTNSCGCSRSGITKKARSRDPQIIPANRVLSWYKSNAHKRGYTVNINAQQFLDISQKPCIYCGDEHSNKLVRSDYTFFYNGLDRIDNTKDYNIDNVVPCCNKCNWIKSNLSVDDMYYHIEKMLEHKQNVLDTII